MTNELKDLGVSITIKDNQIIFCDMEDMEARKYRMSIEKVMELSEGANISIEEAASILGKAMQIRDQCSGKFIRLRRYDDEKTFNAFKAILLKDSAVNFYMKLSQMKYHEIMQIIQSENPSEYYYDMVY